MNTHSQPFSPEDPRLTAYALGELSEIERPAVEATLQRDPTLQAIVKEIQTMSGELTAILGAETIPSEPIGAGATPASVLVQDISPAAQKLSEFDAPKGSRLLRFPGLYYVFATAAAAGFAVLVATRPVHEQFGKVSKSERIQITFPNDTTARFEIVDQIGNVDAKKRPGAPAARNAAEGRERALPGVAAADGLAEAAPPVRSASPATHLLKEAYAHASDNAFLAAQRHPVSTFSIDVDTASYSNVRRLLQNEALPPADAIRIEELVNYFPYTYAPPLKSAVGEEGISASFAAHLEVAAAPWAPEHRLVRIGLKGREIAGSERGPASLVFLLDVSGSMSAANKLPLVKESLRLLLGRLRDDDRVAIVTYAGNSGLALPSTPVRRREEIVRAIESLEPAGATNGAMGIQLAYDIAKANQVAGGLTRVILCTDGDFNVGTTGEGELVRLIAEKAKGGVFLTVLGFGMGNLKDSTLELLADKGNGAYGYVDTRREAEKLLVEQVSGTLVTIAKDVKLQVEFNPAEVASYRLIGYENRLLAQEDFNNDAIDAGEIGAGHTVTALYEVVPRGAETVVTAGGSTDALEYSTPAEISPAGVASKDLFTLRVRYKETTGDVSRMLEFSLRDGGARFDDATADFRFAAAVASFGMILRDSPHRGVSSFASVGDWARKSSAGDPSGYREEFVGLIRQAARLPR